jgi:hypothetical protein
MVELFQIYAVGVVVYVLVVVWSELHGDRVHKRTRRLSTIHSLITGKLEKT